MAKIPAIIHKSGRQPVYPVPGTGLSATNTAKVTGVPRVVFKGNRKPR